ncbi:MAG: OsmC family protein [Candidatus Thorarchaeota archaeon]
MSEPKKVNVGLSLEEGMIFKCELGEMKVEDCYVDDEHDTEASMWGPNPSRMLGMAVMGCLSSSFIFCLKKKGLSLDDLKATAEVTITRNEKGFWRVRKIDVDIKVKIEDLEVRKRADQCKKFWQQFCLVTEAVREGIEIDVNLDY